MRHDAPESDAALVAACRAGRREAFGELVDRYQDRVYRLAWRIVGQREDAAEVAQEAFLKAWRALDRFRGDASFYTWIFRITLNEARSRLRFKAVRPAEVSLYASSAADDAPASRRDPADHGPGPVELANRAERRVLVEQALLRLEPDQRAIILLRDMEGRDYAQIAEMLDCPRGTVKSRLHRARMALKDLLEPALGQDAAADA